MNLAPLVPLTVCLLGSAPTALGQDAGRPQAGWRGAHRQLVWALSEDDLLLPVTSLEWGRPDRFSFTARYLHLVTKERNAKPGPAWIHSFTASLSPGTDGGRVGAGYSGVWRIRTPLITEARVVLLRTWGHPLEAAAGRSFVGPELRLSVVGVVNVGAGWYRQVSLPDGRRASFWGFHAGIGI